MYHNNLKQTHNSIPRNFLIADTFYKSGQIENWGRGTIRICEECEDYGLPIPTFSMNNNLFEVCFNSAENITEKTVEKTVEKILIAIKENPKITQKELAKKASLSIRGVEWNLAQLKSHGILTRIGPDRGGYWQINKQKEEHDE